MRVRVSDVKARKTINNDFHQPSNYCVIVPASYRHMQPRKKAVEIIVGSERVTRQGKLYSDYKLSFVPSHATVMIRPYMQQL